MAYFTILKEQMELAVLIVYVLLVLTSWFLSERSLATNKQCSSQMALFKSIFRVTRACRTIWSKHFSKRSMKEFS